MLSPTILIKPFAHHGQHSIGLYFGYNREMRICYPGSKTTEVCTHDSKHSLANIKHPLDTIIKDIKHDNSHL